MASLFSHNIGLPPVVAHGSAALQQRVVPPVLAGEQVAALAITEPGGGSDVARLRLRARREGGEWVLDGEKTFITSGLRADWITVAARTGGPGAAGVSLLAVPGDAPGLQRTRLQKMGWWCSDTAHLRFDAVRVPADHLIGEENAGFRMIMANFNGERLLMSAGACAFAQACLDEALDWARQRQTFGRALLEQEWELILDAFPDGEIELTKPPVISISSVKYLDQAGAEQTLLSTQYVLDADLLPGYLLPAEGVSWPLTRDVANAVRVRFKCGYGATAAAVPPGIVDWIACEVVTQFDNPDQVAMAKADSAAGSRAMQLLDPYRTYL
jgi:uncharacterized phiE125 gp8 family phage protein